MMKALLTLLAIVVIAVQIGTGVVLWSVRSELGDLAQQVEDAAGGASVDTANLQEQISKRLGTVERTLSETQPVLVSLSEKVDEQSMLTGRALGEIIPYKLPDSVESRLNELKDDLRTALATDPSADTVKSIQAGLGDLVNELPPWAQEEMLPTLVRMRWELEGLWLLSELDTDESQDLIEQTAVLDVLLSNRPLETSDELAAALEDRREVLTKKIAASERVEAIAQAKKGLQGGGDLQAAILSLAPYNDEETKKLVSELTDEILKQTVTTRIETLEADIERISQIQDPKLKDYAFRRANATTLDIRLQAYTLGLAGEQLTQSLDTVASELEAAADKSAAARKKDYQVWALEQIQLVPTIDGIRGTGHDKQQAQAMLRDYMIRYLAPIDEAHLDYAVRAWYGKVYAARFQELKDWGYQYGVISGFAKTPKKSLQDVP